MALVIQSNGDAECTPLQMSWHLWPPNSALLSCQEVSTHLTMEFIPWTVNVSFVTKPGQLMMGLCVEFVRQCQSLQMDAKLGTPRGSITMRKVQPLSNIASPKQEDQYGEHGNLEMKMSCPN